MRKKSIQIEGWRNINHSYAMVNQNQLLELLRMDLDVRHLDLPFYNSNWNAVNNASGFEDADKRKISSILPSNLSQVQDVTYRISFPFRLYPSQSKKTFVYGTSEFQSIEGYIYENRLEQGIKNPSLKIITPSHWSKVGFLNAGFDDSRVLVVPHGVNQNTYQPISPVRRKQYRDALNVSNEDFVMLSLGAMTHNKGIDILIQAYSALKPKYPHLKLVLKDSSNLYGIRLHDVLSELYKQNPQLISQNLSNSIISISENLTQNQLNGLYGAADCYVSPYRAEGFNLTPLEAASSGTPIIITKGGSTDDYFHESFALQIEGKKVMLNNLTSIEPSLESLIEQISNLIEGKLNHLDNHYAQHFIRKKFTWNAVVKQLVSCF